MLVGRLLILHNENLEVLGVVEYSVVERLWVGRIDWDKIQKIAIATAAG
jgi:hypothetical protein